MRNASQLCDGASACVIMGAKLAEQRGLTPLGTFRALAVAGCEPDEMGIGPVFAVPKLLKQQGLAMDDIDLWELNEAFASQVLYCRDRLGIPQDKLNVDGGAISIGHPYRMSGARMMGQGPSARSSPCASAAAWAPPGSLRFIRSCHRRRHSGLAPSARTGMMENGRHHHGPAFHARGI